jgi:putative dimethyl sulfoxide reductase chaperone
MSADDFALLAARADLCRLLAACYYQPGPEFAEEKVFDAMLGAAHRIDADAGAGAPARRGFRAVDPQELLIDYTRLFLGPLDTPPAVRLGLARWPQDPDAGLDAGGAGPVRRGRLRVGRGFRELPDHVAAELEFLYLLLFRQAEACAKATPRRGRACRPAAALARRASRALDRALHDGHCRWRADGLLSRTGGAHPALRGVGRR